MNENAERARAVGVGTLFAWLAALAVALALSAPAAAQASPAPSATAVPPGNAVTDWNEIAQNAIIVGRPVGSALVLEGIVQAAIYDATVAIEGGYEPFVASPSVSRPASTAAAVAAAARGVLVVRVPGQAASVDAQYAAYLVSIPDGPAKTNGIAVGEQVAQAILAWRAGDGFDNVVPWLQPPPGPGVFEPYPAPPPLDVKLKQVRPLTLTSNDQFRPDGPNPLTSTEYAEDFNEVKAYGRIDSAVRTPEQTEVARFWSENTAVQWPRTQRGLALEKGLSLAQTARMLALAEVAAADALLACFDAKSWQPLVPTPDHPEYPGAHGCVTKAVAEALANFFGTDKVPFAMSSTVTGTTHYWDRFREAAKEVYDARTWGGMHFRNSTMEGAWIGEKVTRHVAANFFRPTGE